MYEEKLTGLLEYVRADGRVCPNPQEWQALWEMLPDKKRVGAGWAPPLPLILAAWSGPALTKILRLEEHICQRQLDLPMATIRNAHSWETQRYLCHR